MAQERYFSDTMTLSVATDGGTDIPVGELQEVEVRVEVNEVEHFSAETTKREDVKHTEKVPVVSATISAWDTALIQQWLGGSGASSTGLTDTTDPQKFTLTGSVTPSGGSTPLEAEVVGVTFAEMPIFSASRNEFVGKELEGRGDDIQLTNSP